MGGYGQNPYLSFLLLLAFIVIIVVIGYVLVKLLRRTQCLSRQYCQLKKCCSGKSQGGCKVPKKCNHKCSGGSRGLCDWSQFYAQQNTVPGVNDNPTPIAPGEAVAFPNVGPSKGSNNIVVDDGVSPLGAAIRLVQKGTYLVSLAAQVGEAGQLVVALDSGSGLIEQQGDYVGTPGAGLLSFTTTVTTHVPNVNLYIVNPQNQTTNVTLPPGVGSTGNAAQNAILNIARID